MENGEDSEEEETVPREKRALPTSTTSAPGGDEGHRRTKRRRGGGRQTDREEQQAGLGLLDLPTEVLTHIASFTDNDSALALADTARPLRQVALAGHGFAGLTDPGLSHGLLAAAKRYKKEVAAAPRPPEIEKAEASTSLPVPMDTVMDEPPGKATTATAAPPRTLRGLARDERVDQKKRGTEAYGEAVRSVVWREYSSPLRLPKTAENAVTLRDLASRVDQTYQMNETLRKNVPFMHPVRRYRERSRTVAASTTRRAFAKRVKEINEDPRLKYRGRSSALDKEARAISGSETKVAGGHPRGQNWGITTSKKGEKRVYSNNPPHPKTPGLPPGGGTYPNTSAHRGAHWHEPQGQNRGKYPIPFHPEMQALEDVPPWKVAQAGNEYLSCPQCFAGYQAYGLGHETFSGGTHGRKVASVIPPGIRQNAVYLQKYLGSEAWDQIQDSTPAEAGNILDTIERETRDETVDRAIGATGGFTSVLKPRSHDASRGRASSVPASRSPAPGFLPAATAPPSVSGTGGGTSAVSTLTAAGPPSTDRPISGVPAAGLSAADVAAFLRGLDEGNFELK